MRSEMTEGDGTTVAKVEVVRDGKTNVVRRKVENLGVQTNVVRFVAEVAMTRRQETIAAGMVIHVGMRVVDLEIRMRMNRIAEDRGVMMTPARVRRIAMTAVDVDIVRKQRKGLHDG